VIIYLYEVFKNIPNNFSSVDNSCGLFSLGQRYARGDKSFRLDEWIWFGIVPALAPYLFVFIWKPEAIKNIFKF
jgi:hypothetical protein